MSIDYENITLEELRATPYSQQLEYAAYWQKLLENGIKLEWWANGDNCWECYSAKVRVGYIYRRKTEPKVVPLDFSDYLDIVHKWLIDTSTNEKCFVCLMDNPGNLKVMYSDNFIWCTFSDLQKHYTTLDGKRLEKEEI